MKSGTAKVSANFGNDSTRTIKRTINAEGEVAAAGIISTSRSSSSGTSTVSLSFEGKVITVTFARSGSNTDVVGSLSATVEYWY